MPYIRGVRRSSLGLHSAAGYYYGTAVQCSTEMRVRPSGDVGSHLRRSHLRRSRLGRSRLGRSPLQELCARERIALKRAQSSHAQYEDCMVALGKARAPPLRSQLRM